MVPHQYKNATRGATNTFTHTYINKSEATGTPTHTIGYGDGRNGTMKMNEKMNASKR